MLGNKSAMSTLGCIIRGKSRKNKTLRIKSKACQDICNSLEAFVNREVESAVVGMFFTRENTSFITQSVRSTIT